MQESEAIEKAKRENAQIWARSGYRGIYGRLMESDYFTCNGVSKIVSIRKASFREAVRLISMQNSM